MTNIWQKLIEASVKLKHFQLVAIQLSLLSGEYRKENELTSLDLIQLHDNHKCAKGTIFRKHTQKNCGRSVIKGSGGIDMSAI